MPETTGQCTRRQTPVYQWPVASTRPVSSCLFLPGQCQIACSYQSPVASISAKCQSQVPVPDASASAKSPVQPSAKLPVQASAKSLFQASAKSPVLASAKSPVLTRPDASCQSQVPRATPPKVWKRRTWDISTTYSPGPSACSKLQAFSWETKYCFYNKNE